jgi:hypothetical protein
MRNRTRIASPQTRMRREVAKLESGHRLPQGRDHAVTANSKIGPVTKGSPLLDNPLVVKK